MIYIYTVCSNEIKWTTSSLQDSNPTHQETDRRGTSETDAGREEKRQKSGAGAVAAGLLMQLWRSRLESKTFGTCKRENFLFISW